jgi:hypothetical protein
MTTKLQICAPEKAAMTQRVQKVHAMLRSLLSDRHPTSSNQRSFVCTSVAAMFDQLTCQAALRNCCRASRINLEHAAALAALQ